MSVSFVCSLLFRNKSYFYIQLVGILVIFSTGELVRVLLSIHYTGGGPVNKISYYDNLFKPITTRNIKFYEYDIHIAKWKGKPFTIAHISDIHIADEEDVVYCESISRKLSEYSIDFIFLTGDFVSDYHSYQLLGKALKKLCRTHKTFAVLGNHDYWLDAGKVAEILRQENISLLENNFSEITTDSHSFIVSGFDKSCGTFDYSTHIFPETENIMHLCLCHNPDHIYKLSHQNIDVVFSGHFHAGEIRLPVFGAIFVPSIYSRLFTHGHFLVKNTHLFVTAGMGSSTFRTRIYCNPDIFIIHIKG